MVSKPSDEATARSATPPAKNTQSVPSLSTLCTPTPSPSPTPPDESPTNKVSMHSEGPELPQVSGINGEEILRELQESQLKQDALKAAIIKCRKDIDMLLKKDPVLQQTLDKLSNMMKELEARVASGDNMVKRRLDGIDQQLENLKELILDANAGPEQYTNIDAVSISASEEVDNDSLTDFKNKLMHNTAEIKNLQNRFRLMNKETNRQLHEAQDQLKKVDGDLETMQIELQQILNRSTIPQVV